MPVLIHFHDKPALYRYSSILHRYVYTHIYTYLCTYIYFPEGMFTYFLVVPSHCFSMYELPGSSECKDFSARFIVVLRKAATPEQFHLWLLKGSVEGLGQGSWLFTQGSRKVPGRIHLGLSTGSPRFPALYPRLPQV